jgi:hypothetical protein
MQPVILKLHQMFRQPRVRAACPAGARGRRCADSDRYDLRLSGAPAVPLLLVKPCSLDAIAVTMRRLSVTAVFNQ